MAIPGPFQNQPTAIASFDFTDIVSGKSYLTFYGGKDANSNFFLSTAIINSDFGEQTTLSAGFASPSGFLKRVEALFPTTFDIPQTISGDTFVNATVGFVTADAASNDTSLIVQALKNGVHLVSGSVIKHEQSTGTTPLSHEHAIKLTIPETVFAIGDILSFNVFIGEVNVRNLLSLSSAIPLLTILS